VNLNTLPVNPGEATAYCFFGPTIVGQAETSGRCPNNVRRATQRQNQWKGALDNMFDEKICLENLQRIVFETAMDENIKKISTDALGPSYEEIGDNIFQLSVFNRHKFKNMLWNFDNLKPEVRSIFQKKCFEAWHSIYLKSVGPDLSEERDQNIKKIDIEAADTPDPKDPLKRDIQAPMTETEDVADGPKKKPVEKPSRPSDPKPSAYVERCDWFDKLLDFAAAIVYAFTGIFGR
jgi:hypothetical protein